MLLVSFAMRPVSLSPHEPLAQLLLLLQELRKMLPAGRAAE